MTNDDAYLLEQGKIGLSPEMGLQEEQHEKQGVAQDEDQEFIGFSQRPVPIT